MDASSLVLIVKMTQQGVPKCHAACGMWVFLMNVLLSRVCYSLRPEILVGGMDVSRYILILDTSIFMYFSDKYFRTKGVANWTLI